MDSAEMPAFATYGNGCHGPIRTDRMVNGWVPQRVGSAEVSVRVQSDHFDLN
jgi:hypothetical protein